MNLSEVMFLMARYVTNAEIIEFMQLVVSDFEESDINNMIVQSTGEEINRYLNEIFYEDYDVNEGSDGYEVEVLYIDGVGVDVFYTPKSPIIELNKIEIIKEDDTTVELKTIGQGKNAWVDNSTGRIKVDYTVDDFFLDGDENITDAKDRVRSMKVTGKFGEVPTNLIKYLQLLMILKQYALTNPKKYSVEMQQEKIGRYQYRLYTNPSSVSPTSERVTLDGRIRQIYDTLENSMVGFCAESIGG